MTTIGELIDKYKELEDFVEAEDKVYGEKMKPYRDAINTIKQAALGELQRTGQQNAKSENGGTAYQQTILSVKVDKPDEFIKFIVEQARWDMLSPGALKEPVREYLEQTKAPPPGLLTEFITKCNIRRS
jgi:hypothetical protein